MRKPKTANQLKARSKIILDSFMIILIIVSPFVFKIHEYLPTDPNATINFLWLTIDNNGFNDVSIYVWFLLQKIVPLYLFLIWFFTCKHWWYHILLIPVTMYAFQIFEAVFDQDNYIDTDNILWLLPVCMVIIPFVYFIRIKLYDKYVHGIDLEAMDAELQVLKEKEELRKEREKLEQRKETLSKK